MPVPTLSPDNTPEIEQRVLRLSAAAGRHIVEPDTEVAGSIGDGQVIPDEMLTVAGLGIRLSPEQRATLAREEVASITQAGIRFEAVLEAGFSVQIATAEDLTDPRITFILHEVGEETRHQRLFQRLLAQLAPQAKAPISHRLVRLGYLLVIRATATNPALLYVLVLGGEEIPDLFQKLASEHPETDPFIRQVNRYHRMEEARHLSFARAVFPEVWRAASALDRALVRHVAPRIIRFMFDSMVHPGVYEVVGLPGFATWRAANRTPQRRQLRFEATRPILQVLLDTGAVRPERIPPAWRSLCGMRRDGEHADVFSL
jgi:P-aminobenzoate N-oxygenase AurF